MLAWFQRLVLIYLQCFELWHGNNGEEEAEAEAEEWERNRHKLVWSSSCGESSFGLLIESGFWRDSEG